MTPSLFFDSNYSPFSPLHECVSGMCSRSCYEYVVWLLSLASFTVVLFLLPLLSRCLSSRLVYKVVLCLKLLMLFDLLLVFFLFFALLYSSRGIYNNTNLYLRCLFVRRLFLFRDARVTCLTLLTLLVIHCVAWSCFAITVFIACVDLLAFCWSYTPSPVLASSLICFLVRPLDMLLVTHCRDTKRFMCQLF